MMIHAWSLPIGLTLDVILGDPRGWPHPVRAIGGLITRTERGLRRLLARHRGGPIAERFAGIVLALIVVGSTALTAWAVVLGFDRLGEIGSLAGSTLLIYWGMAARSLGNEALRASEAADLPTARRELAMIVGRETDRLDWPEVHRACVETVAENANDAVVAPLFWFVLLGPVGLWGYKAISTLDSQVGYRDPRYLQLGWASARLDDLAALIPARLTWLILTVAALVLGERPLDAFRIGWRDGRNHPSPNSAWGEAAMAGALRVRLGGPATYAGLASSKPMLGDPGDSIGPATVRRAVRLMWASAAIAAALAWTCRSWFTSTS